MVFADRVDLAGLGRAIACVESGAEMEDGLVANLVICADCAELVGLYLGGGAGPGAGGKLWLLYQPAGQCWGLSSLLKA